MPTRLWSVVFGANDNAALARFWSGALGWDAKLEPEGYWSVARGDGLEPRLEFVTIPEPKTTKNRIHLDLASDSVEHQRAIVDRLLNAGASRIDIGQPENAAWVVLADPEGNEFCVVPPSERVTFTNNGAIGAIAVDEADTRLGRFWSDATGWPIAWHRGGYVGLRSSFGPYMTFGPPVAPKAPKNRIHFDVAPLAGDDHEAEVERLTTLGARRIDIGQGDVPWVVMADPEYNEFCVLTPR
jgi:hypothetical protein